MIKKWLNFFFPQKCALCKIEGKDKLCQGCFSLLEEIKIQECPVCSNTKCLNSCFLEGLEFKTCFKYNNYSGRIIKDLKYNAKIENASLIAHYIFQKFSYIFSASTIILPVNTNFLIQITRRYNVPSLILFNLHKILRRNNLQITSLPFAITKRGTKRTQVGLSRNERLLNIKSAFDIKSRYGSLLWNKEVIILDDVVTTGATGIACALRVQEFNPAKITIISFAQVFPEK